MATKDSKEKYIEGIGRRKNAVARVRITPNSKNSYKINDQSLEDYFKTEELRKVVKEALEREGVKTFSVSAKVSGGGIHAQAESIRLGLSRAIVKDDSQKREELKKAGFLKRDARKKERKKFGLKKARKAAQWSKR